MRKSFPWMTEYPIPHTFTFLFLSLLLFLYYSFISFFRHCKQLSNINLRFYVYSSLFIEWKNIRNFFPAKGLLSFEFDPGPQLVARVLQKMLLELSLTWDWAEVLSKATSVTNEEQLGLIRAFSLCSCNFTVSQVMVSASEWTFFAVYDIQPSG